MRLEALSPESLPIFRQLLGSKEFGGCFCAVWTSFDDTWVDRCKDPSLPNYFITEANCKAGKHVGYLVFSETELIGWTGSGPKTSFPFLSKKLGSRLSASIDTTWSIGCIAVKESARGQGLSDHIAKAVMALARSKGAKVVEAYPTRPSDEARIFRGSHRMYTRLGFEIVNSEMDGDSEILLMKLNLEAAGGQID